MPSSAAHTIPGLQVFGRFPPTNNNLTEKELDPYFSNFETSTRDLESLLQGSIEKVNRRTLTHLSTLSIDMAELGARYNGFSLSEQSPTVAAAIERIGQAADSSYIATEELSATFGANFAEPMRESAQFAGIVRNVLRYRVLKRVQQEMTKDELYAKKQLLDSLERSEMEAKRIEQYINSSGPPSGASKRSTPSASAQGNKTSPPTHARQGDAQKDSISVDSDFAPSHRDEQSASAAYPENSGNDSSPTSGHKKSQSGGFVANKILGRISHAVHGIVDVDPERTRRDAIGKTKESLSHVRPARPTLRKGIV